jgi:hypothetical protein
MFLDLLFSFQILLRILNNSSISRSRLIDKTVDELMELRMSNYSLLILSDSLHVLEDLLKLSNIVGVSGVKYHAIVIRGKGNEGVDAIFSSAITFVHFSVDKISGVLIDGDLGLYNHVVDQSDEGAKGGIVLLGESHNFLLELLLLLHNIHRLVLIGLAHASFKVFIFLKVTRICNRFNKVRENVVDDLLNTSTVVLLNLVPLSLLIEYEIIELVTLTVGGDLEGQL